MVVIAISLVAGFVFGRLLRLRHATSTPPAVHLLGVLLVGAAFGLAAEFTETSFEWPLTLASLALLTSFLIANLRLVGMPIVMVGMLCNIVVVVANEGMPVRGDALVAAGLVDTGSVESVHLNGRRHLETGSDRVTVLGDIIPVRPLREVVSFGDLIMAAGAANVAARLTRPRGRRARAGRVRRRTQRSEPIVDLTGSEPTDDDELPWWAETINDLDRPTAATSSP